MYQCPKCLTKFDNYVSRCTNCGVNFRGTQEVSKLARTPGEKFAAKVVVMAFVFALVAAGCVFAYHNIPSVPRIVESLLKWNWLERSLAVYALIWLIFFSKDLFWNEYYCTTKLALLLVPPLLLVGAWAPIAYFGGFQPCQWAMFGGIPAGLCVMWICCRSGDWSYDSRDFAKWVTVWSIALPPLAFGVWAVIASIGGFHPYHGAMYVGFPIALVAGLIAFFCADSI